jgi:hypothetical protein
VDVNDQLEGFQNQESQVAVPSGTIITEQPDHSPAEPAPVRQEATPGVVRQMPVDKELPGINHPTVR